MEGQDLGHDLGQDLGQGLGHHLVKMLAKVYSGKVVSSPGGKYFEVTPSRALLAPILGLTSENPGSADSHRFSPTCPCSCCLCVAT